MLTYRDLRNRRKEFLSLTGLTVVEFQRLLGPFALSCRRAVLSDRTSAGHPRRRHAGGGRHGVLHSPEQKLLFLLVYLKAYPLQTLLGELFGMSQSRVTTWIHRLLPVLREALAELDALPERDPSLLARDLAGSGKEPRLIIDGTDRRRQRPKNPENQAAHYSGKKKAHSDKNVVVTDVGTKRIEFPGATAAGAAHDKGIADRAGIAYPPGTVLYQDGGFQGYTPPVAEIRQPKKKAEGRRTHPGREAGQPEVVPRPREGRTRDRRREAEPHTQGRVPEHDGRRFGRGHGSRPRAAQPPGTKPQETTEKAKH